MTYRERFADWNYHLASSQMRVGLVDAIRMAQTAREAVK